MKNINRLVLVLSLAIASIPFSASAQEKPTFTEIELAFLRRQLQLDKPVAQRPTNYQLSTHPDAYQNQGRAYIHKQLESGEIALTVLAPEALRPMAYFGFSADIQGDLAVVGAPGDGAFRTGAVYVFRKSNNSWKTVARLTAEDAGIRDDFGYSVHLLDNVICVGAPGANSKYDDTGAVYVFEQMTQNSWHQVAKLSPEDQRDITSFGSYIESVGRTIIVGAEAPYLGKIDSNKAFTFVNVGGNFERAIGLSTSEEIHTYIASQTLDMHEHSSFDAEVKNQMAIDAIGSDEINVDIAGTKHLDLED